ncbi:glycoside hydrolase family 32 protein [Paenibacillus stellifer]|uniref:glycoside hydrolase family 32 protein n=1 Tax=Paenibacillus stellifer TaxID=169760 RepID=UPI0006921E29|nr:glycoside hydrolase family 32 protein [Paenibacillus stellifer]
MTSKGRKAAGAMILAGCLIAIWLAGYETSLNKDAKPDIKKSSIDTYNNDNHQKIGLRPVFHFTVPDKWKNDPQRPVYANGQYHYYYLYNGDYLSGSGTEWRHAVSSDLVNWQDKGIAIPKFTTVNGDIWSGSVVVDEENTAGFGPGAFIAVLTQPSGNDGKQEQFLWYSTDGGDTFKPYGTEPVLANPGSADFRDPKIIWDDGSGKWVMTLAEGDKIGFYASSNLKEWQYVSGFVTENIGLMECPDLYVMRADDGQYRYVLGVSANGKRVGKPGTYAYWTGSFDGTAFVPDRKEPQWLDYGFDWYGAVTFEDGAADDLFDHRYALAWMNSWDYPDNNPSVREGYNGMDSIVREIRLAHREDGYTLLSTALPALQSKTLGTEMYPRIELEGNESLHPAGAAYRLDADISWSSVRNAGFRLMESPDGKSHVDIGVFAQGGYLYVNRGSTGNPDRTGNRAESRAPLSPDAKKVHLTIFVDRLSIEVFVDDGETVFSNLVFPDAKDQGISLYAEGGTAVFENVVIQTYSSR